VIKFQHYDCDLQRSTYANGRVALQLRDANDGQPIVRATINLADTEMDADEAAINHDFAQEIEGALVQAGVIAPHHRTVRPRGSWVDFRICRLIGE
jgi:hypothetical protein